MIMPFFRSFSQLTRGCSALLFCACLLTTAFAESLINVNFGDETTLKPIESNKPDRIRGVLPPGVKEDSGWADIAVSYDYEANRLGGDIGTLRVKVTDHEKGRAQLKFMLPRLNEKAYYRLTVRASSPDKKSLTVAVRQPVPPYETIWEGDIPLSPGLTTTTLPFELPPLNKKVVLLMYLGESGTYDLQRLTLDRVTLAQLQAQQADAVKSSLPNVLPWSDFPLGLPTGWGAVMTRLSTELDYEMEPAEEPTERGTFPLRLKSKGDEQVQIASAPLYLPLATQPHTFSYYIKGKPERGAVMEIAADGKPIAQRPVFGSSDGTFKRESFKFQPTIGAKFHTIRLRNLKGEIELDALMLSPGEEAQPFQRQAPAEVALTSDWSKNHVFLQGVDQEPVIQYAVAGSHPGAVLKSRIFNLYGQSKNQPDITLPEGAHAKGTIKPGTPFPKLPYGPFRVEAWVEADGKRLSPIAENVYFWLRKPRFWGRIAPESSFGVHVDAYEPHLYSSKAIGANWNRFHGPQGYETTYWSTFEPEKGKYNYNDETIDLYRKYDHALMGVLVHTPQWARVQRSDVKGGWLDEWWQPKDYQDYGNYVTKVVTHNEGRIDAWQIWNEPWGEFWFKDWRPELGYPKQWHHGDSHDEDYLELSKVAYRAAKATGTKVPIVGIHATIGDKGKDWMARMAKLGIEKYQDAGSFHAYIGDTAYETLNPEGMFQTRLEDRMMKDWRKTSKADEQDLWVTETQQMRRIADTGMLYHLFNGKTSPLDLIRQNADRQGPFQLILFSEGIDKIILYSMIGFDYGHPGQNIDWSCLVMKNGELDPSAAAYSNFTWQLDGREFADRKTIKPGIEWFLFKPGKHSPDDKMVAVLAPNLDHASAAVPAMEGLTVYDFLGNPLQAGTPLGDTLVYLTFPTGKEKEVEAAFLAATPTPGATPYPKPEELPAPPELTLAQRSTTEPTGGKVAETPSP